VLNRHGITSRALDGLRSASRVPIDPEGEE
jgi:hypothetical protein